MQKRFIQRLTISVLVLMFTAITSSGAFAASIPNSRSLSGPAVTNPYVPTYQHSYRHGAIPTVSQLSKIKSYQQSHKNVTAPTSGDTLSYGGGIDGIGVTSGTPKVYLVFWGTQWGTKSTDNAGNLTFSNDSAGGAPYIQKLFKGLGTGGELWSGTMTQYCDGPGVIAGATSCPVGAAYVGYPTGGPLAGVWYDNAGSEPNPANGNQLANEAIKAASHFGNTTAASNRYAQYVIMSAKGNNPDNYQTQGYCAWHDYNSDSSLSGGAATSHYGDIAFTNLPYLLDVGSNCGQNFVNADGNLDGYSIVEGHEYAETITDQNPAGGWTNTGTGQENGDECAWITPDQPGGSGNVSTGSGIFAMQSTWSNDTDSCDLSHPISNGGPPPPPPPNDFSISTSPAVLPIVPGSGANSVINTAITSGSEDTIKFSTKVSPSGPTVLLGANSVPAGFSVDFSVNVGPSVPLGTYTVTLTGTEGSTSHSTLVTVVVTSTIGHIVNGDFELGSLSGWTSSGTTSIDTTVHSGYYSARVGSTEGTKGESSIKQEFAVPAGTTTLSFYYKMVCTSSLTENWAQATLKDNTTGTTQTILPKTCTLTNIFDWSQVTTSVIAGHSYTLTLSNHDNSDSMNPTYTFYDDVTLSY